MKQKPNYRHELKFEITYGNYLTLRSHLSAVMKQDSHINADGKYHIHSLYFDNYNDKALFEKLDGVQKRDKYRIRYYDRDLSFISLEKKSKHNQLCLKKSCPISKEECRKILDGNIEWICETGANRPVLNDFFEAYVQMQMRPKTIVSYEREPWTYAPGNVRITFDMNIRSGLYHTDFLNPDSVDMPVFTENMIMEVKYDEYLPDIIKLLIQTPYIRVGAFSKYAACRNYE